MYREGFIKEILKKYHLLIKDEGVIHELSMSPPPPNTMGKAPSAAPTSRRHRCVSKICIFGIFIAALASKIFSYCWLSPPLTFQKCYHLEPNWTFPFVFQWTSLKFPSSSDLIICCNHVKELQQKRADAFVFERFGFWCTKVHDCSLYLNNDLMPCLCVETNYWDQSLNRAKTADRKSNHPASTSLSRVFRFETSFSYWNQPEDTLQESKFLSLLYLIEYLKPLNPPPFLWPSFPTNILHFLSASDIIASHRPSLRNTSDARQCYIDSGRKLGGARRSASDARRKQITEIFHTVDGWRVVRLSCCPVALLRNHQGVRTINPLTLLADGVAARGLTINNQADHLNKPSLSDRWHKGYVNVNE